MKLLSLTLALAVLGAGASTLQPSAGAEPAASRILDRTVVCAAGLSGGIHEIEVEAKSASGTSRPGNDAYVTVGSNLQPISFLASLSQAALDLNPACRRVRATVSLSARRLAGGTVGETYETIDCATPRRVLVRMRVTFRMPVTLRRTNDFGYPQLTARGDVMEGAIAVRTETGKRLVLARLLRSGKVQVFADVPRSCIPD